MPTRKKNFRTCCLLVVMISLASVGASAGEPMHLFNFFTGKKIDLASHSCEKCGRSHAIGEYCISRQKVETCVVGKKKVFDSKIKYEWVSIPETRYHWKKKLITEEVDCPYCKPVCKTEDCERCVGRETWVKHGDECNEIHCRLIEPVIEKAETKHCEHEEGETTVRVKYWSCVKVPYIVYRRVKQPVCVKQPRYVKAKVSITRYVCRNCGEVGCGGGCDGFGYPNPPADFESETSDSDAEGDSDSDAPEELPAPAGAESIEGAESTTATLPPVFISDTFRWNGGLSKNDG